VIPRIPPKTLAAIEEIKATDQPANDPKGVPISRVEACRLAREALENAEAARAETAEHEAKGFREQSARDIIEEFLDYAREDHNIELMRADHWSNACLRIGQLSAMLDAFEQKEKQRTTSIQR